MAANLIDPVVKDYLFHDSPLRTVEGKRSFWIIVAVTLVLSVVGWVYFLNGRNISEYLIWIPLPILGSIIGYLILAFLDRERRVRVFHFATILATLLFTTAICAFFNTVSPAPRLTVGLVEEFFKILPVLVLAIFVPNLIRTRKDGLVYGAMAGLGLNMMEIGAYIAQTLSKTTMDEALITHLTRLGLWGIGGHIILSAFVGMGVGMAAESNKTGWAKWKPAIICFVLAAIAHTVFDNGGSAIGIFAILGIESLFGVDTSNAFAVENSGKLGPLNDAFRYGTYVFYSAFLIAMIIHIRKSTLMENILQVEELSTEDPTVVKKGELELVKGERLFFKRKYREYTKQVGSKIVMYQNLLAIQKHDDTWKARGAEADQVVVNLRDAIRSLRGPQPPAN